MWVRSCYCPLFRAVRGQFERAFAQEADRTEVLTIAAADDAVSNLALELWVVVGPQPRNAIKLAAALGLDELAGLKAMWGAVGHVCPPVVGEGSLYPCFVDTSTGQSIKNGFYFRATRFRGAVRACSSFNNCSLSSGRMRCDSLPR